MPAYNQFKKQVKELMKQGCAFESAISKIKTKQEYSAARSEYEAIADQADKLLEIKLQVEWEIEIGE